MANSTFALNALGGGGGSAFQIGDGFALTAGHVVFEAGGSVSNPVVNVGATIADDYRGYQAAYQTALNTYTSTHGTFPSIGTMEAGLIPLDSVVISHSGIVGSSGAGLFLALDDTTLTGFQGYLGTGAKLQRDGRSDGRVTGNFVSVTNTTLHFDVMANTNPNATHGDSGGVYLIVAGGREYVVGTQSGNNNTANYAIGTRFTEDEWYRLSELVVSQLSGDITLTDPTNMAVGTANADILSGSGRADILLGRGGQDYLYGGDKILSSAQIAGTLVAGEVWANDQLYGGADDDTFDAGMGSDLLHGGDRIAAGVTATAISADGVDGASYSILSTVDADKGVVIHVRESASLPAQFQTHSAVSDFASAIFVEDLGRDKTVDTLISIETIIATDADDTLRIDTLAGSKLAGSNGQGGLLEVDLGNQLIPSPEGDIVDMSRLEEAAVINWQGPALLATFVTPGTLTVRGVETLKATKADDTITVSAYGVRVRGAGGDDTIDATAGSVNVDWLKGDGLDTIATNYGSVNINTLTLANYESVLQPLDPRGVVSVNFSDMNKNEAELVLKNLTLIDSQSVSSNRYLYTADVYILEIATGKGVNLGKAVAASIHYDLNFSAGYLSLFNLPEIAFADGNLGIGGEGGPNIAFRIDNGAQPRPSSMPIFSAPDIVSIPSWGGFENAGVERELLADRQHSGGFSDDPPYATRPQPSGVSDQVSASMRSAQLLVQAMSAFGHSSSPDEGAFSRTHELPREMGFFVNRSMEL